MLSFPAGTFPGKGFDWIVLYNYKDGEIYRAVTDETFETRQKAMDYARRHLPEGVQLFGVAVHGAGPHWLVVHKDNRP